MSDEKAPTEVQGGHPQLNAELEELRSMFNTYARPAVIIALGITVAIVGVKRLRSNAIAKQQSAAAMLATAADEAAFEAVINDYPKSKAAPRAMLALAKLHYSQARYPQAIEQYEVFATSYPTHELLPAAKLGTLICKAAQTPSEGAAQELADFATAHPDHFLTPQATLAQASCLISIGKTADARILLEDMAAGDDEDGWSTIADEQLERLTTQIERDANPMPVPAQPEVAPIQLPATPIAGPVASPAVALPPAPEPSPEAGTPEPGNPIEGDEPSPAPAE